MGLSSDLYIKIQDELINTGAKVENGEMSYLDALVYFSQQEERLDECKDLIKGFKEDNISQIEDEVRGINNEPYKGYEIKINSGRKIIEYKGLKEWDNIEKEKKEIEAKYKTALYSYEKGITPIDENTGEIIEKPQVKYGKSYLTIKNKNT